MESLKMTFSEKREKELKEAYETALRDPNFKNLVHNLKIPAAMGMKNTSKLKDSVQELKNCRECKGLLHCHNKVEGHVYIPEIASQNLRFDYISCKYQKELNQERLAKENAVNEIANARMKDIDVTDKNRVKLVKWLKNFYDQYATVNTLKGLYLHGSFGSGKTFLLAALLNELHLKKGANIAVVYWPEALSDMKEDFALVADKLNYYQNVDILLIDDIGAEKVTEWGRDEILGTILQTRMNQKLTTFFTSNCTIEELEQNLAITKNGVDKVKARRIIERIKQLTTDMELISINRRQ